VLALLAAWSASPVWGAASGFTPHNWAPAANGYRIDSPVLSITMLTPSLIAGTSISFAPSQNAGSAFPPSNRTDFTIDFNLMLPNVLDDPTACTQYWQTSNEFGQDFTNAFVLVQQSACGWSWPYLSAQMSGAAGIIAYGCPAAAPYNCDTGLQLINSYYPIDIPLISISTADGDKLVNLLADARAAALASGTSPALDTLSFRAVSTGPTDTAEIDALIDIIDNSNNPYNLGFVLPAGYPTAGLPTWAVGALSTGSQALTDPCVSAVTAPDVNGYTYTRLFGTWCEAGHIVSIDLSLVAFGGVPFPPAFSLLPNLRAFHAWGHTLQGDLPPAWCALTALQSLVLDQSVVSAVPVSSLPDCMGSSWLQLRLLSVGGLGLSALPASLSNLAALAFLDAPANALTSIPDVSAIWGLVRLNLYGNAITSINSLVFFPGVSVATIALGANQLTDNLDPNLFNALPALQILDLNQNRLTGTLPLFINTQALRILDLSNQRDIQDQLDGMQPIDLGGPNANNTGFYGGAPFWSAWQINLKNLQQLHLQGNRLDGPFFLTYMVTLTTIDLSFNRITSQRDPEPVVSPYTDIGYEQDNAMDWLQDAIVSLATTNFRASYNIIAGTMQDAAVEWGNSLILRTCYMDHNLLRDLPLTLFSRTSLAEIDLHGLNHCRLHTDSNTQRLRCGQLTSMKLTVQESRLVAEPVEALRKAGLFRRYVLPSLDE